MRHGRRVAGIARFGHRIATIGVEYPTTDVVVLPCNHLGDGGVLTDVCTTCSADLARDVTAAFPTLVAHHQDLVYGIARRSTATGEDAEDLAQEAFVRAWRALAGYDPDRIAALRTRGWLAAITLNVARNVARDRARSPDAGATDLAAVPEPADRRAEDPAGVAERREAAQRWRRLLGRLPASQRLAVELRHVDGLSYPELAEALGRPIGTVKSDVHRGVQALRRAYEADEAGVPVRSTADGGVATIDTRARDGAAANDRAGGPRQLRLAAGGVTR